MAKIYISMHLFDLVEENKDFIKILKSISGISEFLYFP